MANVKGRPVSPMVAALREMIKSNPEVTPDECRAALPEFEITDQNVYTTRLWYKKENGLTKSPEEKAIAVLGQTQELVNILGENREAVFACLTELGVNCKPAERLIEGFKAHLTLPTTTKKNKKEAA